MGVNVQNTEAGIALRQGPQIAQGHAVVAANHPHSLAQIEGLARLAIDPAIHLLAGVVHLIEGLLKEGLLGDGNPFLHGLNHPVGHLPHGGI